MLTKIDLMKKFESIDKTPNAFSIETICQSDNFIRNLFEVIESHQNETAVQFGKSIIYFIEDDFKNMLQCLEYLIELFPNITLLHRRIAEVHIYENNYQKAVPHLEKVIELDKKDLTAKVWLNLSYFKMGKAKKANDSLSELKKLVFILTVKERNYSGRE